MGATEAQGHVETYVRLTLGGELYALPVGEVVEVGDLPAVAHVPGAPAAVLGVCNLRGSVLPVVDARALLGTDGAGGPARRLVVTEREGRRVGLAVAAVTDVGPLPEAREPTDATHLASAVVLAGELVGLLDLDSLLSTIEASS